MARPHEYAAITGNEGEHMAGADKVCGADVWVGECTTGVGPVFSGNARCGAVAHINRDRKGRRQRRVIIGDHRVQT